MNNDLEQFSENMLKKMAVGDIFATTLEQAALARIALAAKQAKPVACKFGKNNGDGTYTPTYDYWPLPSYIKPHKDWPVTLFYDAPQPAHAEQSEMLNKARSLSESIGELRKQIDSSGGYDFEALRSEQVNSPVIPDSWKLVPIEPTDAMKKAYYESSLAPISKLSVTGYRALIAAAPKPESE